MSIIIVNWNGMEVLRTCLTSLERTNYRNYKVIVIDNGSSDNSVSMVRKMFRNVDVIENRENTGFSRANNQGIRLALNSGADYILLLNNDTVIKEEDWLERILDLAEADPRIGIIGPRLVYPNGSLQVSAHLITPFGLVGCISNTSDRRPVQVDGVVGAALLIKRAVIERIGLLDEGYSPYLYEETDYCLRAKKIGFRVMYYPSVSIVHHLGLSMNKVDETRRLYISFRNIARFRLLNYPALWLVPSLTILLLGAFAERRDPLVFSVGKLERTSLAATRMLLIVRAGKENLAHLHQIVALRMQNRWLARYVISLGQKEAFRVCVLTTARLGELTGGLEYFVIQLANLTQDQGHLTAIVYGGLRRPIRYTLDPGSLNRPEARGSASPAIPRLPTPLYFFSLLFFSFLAVITVLKLNRRCHFGIIHSHDAGYSGLSGLICARAFRVPLIAQVHGMGYVDTAAGSRSPFPRFLVIWDAALQRFVANHASMVVAVSKYIQGALMRIGVPRERIHVISSGRDLSPYRLARSSEESARRSLGIPKTSFVVGYVGRLSPGKGIMDLLEAFAKVVKNGSIPKNSRLVIVGSGTLREDVSDLSKSHGIEGNVLLTGTRHDVDQILRAFDVFVLPSISEGRPLSLLEALAAGRAIVASNIPPVAEIIRNGENGLLVPPSSPTELGEAITKLFRSRALRMRLASGAFSTDLSNFEMRPALTRFLAIYRAILKL